MDVVLEHILAHLATLAVHRITVQGDSLGEPELDALLVHVAGGARAPTWAYHIAACLQADSALRGVACGCWLVEVGEDAAAGRLLELSVPLL